MAGDPTLPDRAAHRRPVTVDPLTGDPVDVGGVELRELVPRVLSVPVRRGADFATAEDAVQEALIRALSAWGDELVGGLTTRQIAQAYLVPEPTMAQRISRAKRIVSEAGVAAGFGRRPGDVRRTAASGTQGSSRRESTSHTLRSRAISSASTRRKRRSPRSMPMRRGSRRPTGSRSWSGTTSCSGSPTRRSSGSTVRSPRRGRRRVCRTGGLGRGRRTRPAARSGRRVPPRKERRPSTRRPPLRRRSWQRTQPRRTRPPDAPSRAAQPAPATLQMTWIAGAAATIGRGTRNQKILNDDAVLNSGAVCPARSVIVVAGMNL